MSLSKTPTYNLKAVLKETGLKADVLRAWERRYGLPAPERTEGGHRMYSDFDVALLKWLIFRQNEGLSISRAVELWKEQLLQGHDPLTDAPVKPPATALSAPSIEAIRSHWLAGCLSFNEIAAEQALNQAFALYPVETICTEVLQRGMAEIGNLWYENNASVQQEHFASALAMRRLDRLLGASPAPTRPQTILIGCPPDEWHTFTPLLLALLLRYRGLNVIYLGANVPVDRFEETILAVKADLVILAAQQLISAATLKESARLMTAHGAPVAFGGRIFSLQPGLVKRIAGHYLGDRLDYALDQIESLLAGKPDSPQPVLPSVEYVETLNAFLANRPLIESSLDADARAGGFNLAYFDTAHKFMGDNIIACLRLGEMTYLDSEIDWLTIMLKGLNLPVSWSMIISAYIPLPFTASWMGMPCRSPPVLTLNCHAPERRVAIHKGFIMHNLSLSNPRTAKIALWAGIAFSFAFTALIWWLGGRLNAIPLLPDQGALWYTWKLPDPTFVTRLSVWSLYALHQISFWGLIYYAQTRVQKYAIGLHPVNLGALGLNAVFLFLHLLQTHLWYDGLAQDTPVWSSQGSVILMLCAILIMENRRRGMFFGRPVPISNRIVSFARQYHGYLFSWATVYTFWFHPMVNTPGHLVGFFYMFLLLLQGSLFLTRIHVNKWWTLTQEVMVLFHGTLVAIFQGNGFWPMFAFGFAGIFVISQMHGLGWSKLTRWLVGLGYIVAALMVYSDRGWIKLNEIIRIPLIEYLVAFAIAGLIGLGIWIADRLKKHPAVVETAATD